MGAPKPAVAAAEKYAAGPQAREFAQLASQEVDRVLKAQQMALYSPFQNSQVSNAQTANYANLAQVMSFTDSTGPVGSRGFP